MNVGLAGDAGESALPLGSVDRATFLALNDVLDQGGNWVFHFSYGGVDAAELRLTRAELAAADWTVTVPATVAGRLRDAGLQPTPPPSPDDPQHL